MGACTLMERALDTDLVWIACRHHVFEVMLSDVFSVAFRTSSVPAPLNDARLLAQIQAYPHRAIGNAAAKTFHRHLWYF